MEEHQGQPTFDLTGDFRLLPNDAIAILSDDNSHPLAKLNVEWDGWTLSIVDLQEEFVTFHTPYGRIYPDTVDNVYLGVICSADKSVVYWVNHRRPLP